MLLLMKSQRDGHNLVTEQTIVLDSAIQYNNALYRKN